MTEIVNILSYLDRNNTSIIGKLFRLNLCLANLDIDLAPLLLLKLLVASHLINPLQPIHLLPYPVCHQIILRMVLMIMLLSKRTRSN